MQKLLVTPMALALTCLLLSGVSVSAQSADALTVLKSAIDQVNAGNVEAATALFADDGVVIIPAGTYRGTAQIRQANADNAANHMRLDVSNLQVSGDKVTYSFKQSNDQFRKLGVDFITGSGEAVIQAGKIKSLSSLPDAESSAKLQAALAAAQQAPWPLPVTGAAGDSEALWGLGLAAVLLSVLGLTCMRLARRV